MSAETDAVAAADGRDGRPPSAPTIGVGMLGYAFMGKAHSNAWRTLAYMTWPPPLMPRLVSVAGRNAGAVAEAAERYGFCDHATDWRQVVADDRVEIFDNTGPNDLHGAPTIAAAEAGKHVICEKPLGRTADEAYEIWRRVDACGVQHLAAFNYRFVPAIRLAREMIEAGEIGEIRHYRAQYLQDWLTDPDAPATWRMNGEQAGSGALGDLGSHIVDLGRYLVGEIATVAASVRTFVGERPGGTVDVDDAFSATVEFAGGALGVLEATRVAAGRKNALRFEINGTKGSLAFDLERLNELEVHLVDSTPGRRAQGFRTVSVTAPDHPFLASWWPEGHVLGWEHTFVHELHHFLSAIRDGGPVTPHGADFRDGYRAAEVCDAIIRSADAGRRETVRYRELPAP
jgi:predicted dehydrogenase